VAVGTLASTLAAKSKAEEEEEIQMAEKGAATQTALESVSAKESVPVKMTSNDLIERFNKVYDEIANRAFSIFEKEGGIFGRDLENWFKAETELLHPVHVSVAEADGTVTVQAEVPGFAVKDLEVTLEPQRLIISGKRETKEETQKGKTVYKEQCSNQIFRAVSLPAEVDASKATATLKNGVLELQVPKSTKALAKSVEVKIT
jgi:HSP20 family protein